MNVLPCTYRLVGYLYFTYINPPGPRNGDLKLPVRRGVMSAVPNGHEGEEHLGSEFVAWLVEFRGLQWRNSDRNWA